MEKARLRRRGEQEDNGEERRDQVDEGLNDLEIKYDMGG